MKYVIVLLWALAVVFAAFLVLIFWPIRLRLSAHFAEGRASVTARLLPWPHLFSFPVYKRDIIPRKGKGSVRSLDYIRIREMVDRLEHLAPVFSAALSKRHKLIKVTWHSLVGLGDAALTAMACGSLWVAKSALLAGAYARWGRKSDLPEYSVTPIFDEDSFLSDLDMIVEISVASLVLTPSFSTSMRDFIAATHRRENEGTARDQ